MNKFTNVVNTKVDLGVITLNTELVFLTENNEQVGSLLLVYEDNKASVYSLEVLQSSRKKGYGKKLMEKAMLRCKEVGCGILELNTDKDNVPANRLYQALGFEMIDGKFGFNSYSKSL